MEWISVKDRLPDFRQWVIVAGDDGYIAADILFPHMIEDGKDWFWGHSKILYWMPAPSIDGLEGVTPDKWKE